MAEINTVKTPNEDVILNTFLRAEDVIFDGETGKKYILVAGELDQTVSSTLANLVTDGIIEEIAIAVV